MMISCEFGRIRFNYKFRAEPNVKPPSAVSPIGKNLKS